MADSWHADHASALRLAQKVSEAIEQRNSLDRISSQFSRYDGEAKRRLREYSSVVADLRQMHIKNSQSFHLTQGEVNRRQGMLEELQTREKQLEQMLGNNGNAFGGAGAGHHPDASSSTNPWLDEDDFGNEMDVHEIRQHQQNLVKEQDEGLGILSQVIQRQKSMAVDIGNEIDRQDDLIDDIHTNVDRTDSRVREETEHVRKITLKEDKGNCAMWVVMILLFVAIIVVVCIPNQK